VVTATDANAAGTGKSDAVTFDPHSGAPTVAIMSGGPKRFLRGGGTLKGDVDPHPFSVPAFRRWRRPAGQVFFLHVEMMLMEVLIVLGMKSSERRGSAAALRAEEAGKFAFKTERGRESALDPSRDALLG
jgi:hypothetical protein